MNRTDTKFAFNIELLPEILSACKNNYRVLEINQLRIASYKTLYYDTTRHDLYLHHHNEKPARFKVRIRNYVESGLFYLEAKLKIKGRTVKSRIRLEDFEEQLSDKAKSFIQDKTNSNIDLFPALWNSFNRITLVNNLEKERLTIDFGLTFEWEGKKQILDRLAIIEVKQETLNRSSKIIEVLRQHGIRESGMSKYCLGSVLLNNELKYNNFKAKILQIKKITKAA